MFNRISISSYIDPDWTWSMISFRELALMAWGKRKISFVAFYLLVTIMLSYSQIKLLSWCHLIVKSMQATITPLGIFFFAYEPLSLLLMMVVATFPSPREEPDEENGMDECERFERNSKIAIVVPCHKSASEIKNTVMACCVHVKPHQVFIVDNGNAPEPLDNTLEILENECPAGVNYIWNPYGNKTLAQYAGTIAAKDYEYILIIDDDVTLPKKFSFNSELIKDNVKAVCFPILAIHPEERETLFVLWQQCEYKIADYARLPQRKYSTVLFPHGAVSLWKREIFLQILREHDTVFYADDFKMGLWMQKNGYEMEYAPLDMVATEAPTSVCGPAPNYYCQRVRSWDMAEHAYCWDTFKSFLFTKHSTVVGTLIMKMFQFYSLFCLFADWCRGVVVIWSLITRAWFLLMIMGCVFVGNTIVLCIWNYFGFRRNPEMRCDWRGLLTFQIYRLISMLVRTLGFLRAFFIFLPNYAAKPKIPDIEQKIAQEFKSSACAETVAAATVVPVWLSDDTRFSWYKQEFVTKCEEERLLDDCIYDSSQVQYHLVDSPPGTSLLAGAA